MRLINTGTLQLEEFYSGDIPPYAILSHTWTQDEISFQEFSGQQQYLQVTWRNFRKNIVAADTYPDDLTEIGFPQNAGLQKIYYLCLQAEIDGLRYAWCDTCCIDKSSSTELSEAINSMWNWYKHAKVCYAFLTDFEVSVPETLSQLDIRSFSACRWFTRGFCLQELVAPTEVQFFDVNWTFCGTKKGLRHIISKITRIDVAVLVMERQPREFTVARRMSWAAERVTSRPEDGAYSLLGLFGVNMPLLYGEGIAAFQRLQEEILRNSTDHSIFAWDLHRRDPSGDSRPYLAESPMAFMTGYRILPYPIPSERLSYRITNIGLEITLPVLLIHHQHFHPQIDQRIPLLVAILNCRFEENFTGPIAVQIIPASNRVEDIDEFKNLPESVLYCRIPSLGSDRDPSTRLFVVPAASVRQAKIQKLCILPRETDAQSKSDDDPWAPITCSFRLETELSDLEALAPVAAHPADWWNIDMNVMLYDLLSPAQTSIGAILLENSRETQIVLVFRRRPTISVQIHVLRCKYSEIYAYKTNGEITETRQVGSGDTKMHGPTSWPQWLKSVPFDLETSTSAHVSLAYNRETVVTGGEEVHTTTKVDAAIREDLLLSKRGYVISFAQSVGTT